MPTRRVTLSTTRVGALTCGRSTAPFRQVCSRVCPSRSSCSPPIETKGAPPSRHDSIALPTALPAGALVLVDETTLPDGTKLHIALSSPEFCFLQMARSLAWFDLIALGFELCRGLRARPRCSARVSPPAIPSAHLTISPPSRQVPITSRGAKAARKAAQQILQGSRSPRKRRSACSRIFLDSREEWGARPLLDQEIEAPDPAARILGARTFQTRSLLARIPHGRRVQQPRMAIGTGAPELR